MPSLRLPHPTVRTQLTLLLLIVALGQACSLAKRSSADDADSHLKAGDYLREDYIEALCETLSPLHATRQDDDPQMITVDQGPAGVSFMPEHNFHEGDNFIDH